MHFSCPCCGTGGTAFTDHFAPRYIVGNVPAGDSPIPQTGNFRYIPDPGDGSGIALAAAEAILSPGDIYIRPGSYDFGILPIGPITFPDKISVKGSGNTTVIVGAKASDQGIFILGADSTLANMRIVGGDSLLGPAGSEALILVNLNGNLLENLDITLTTDAPFVTKFAILDVSTDPSPFPEKSNKYNNLVVNVIFPFASADIGNPASCITHRSSTGSGVVYIEQCLLKGGVRGINVTSLGGPTFVDETIIINQKEFGIYSDADSFIRIDNTIIIGPFETPQPTYIGIRFFKGAGFLLSNSAIINPGEVVSAQGIYFGSPDGVIYPNVHDCFFLGFTTAILLGAGLDNINGAFVRGNVFIGANVNAVRVIGQSNDVSIIDNKILMPSGILQTAIQIDGGIRHKICKNTIEQFNDTALVSSAIDNAGISTNIEGNIVNYSGGGAAVSSAGEHCQIVGNFIDKTNIDVVAALLVSGYGTTVSANDVLCNVDQANTCAPIQISADLCAVTGNKTRSAPLIKAINLFASNCTAIGNACEGPGGLPIGDFGAGNIYDAATAALKLGFNSWT